MSLLKRTWWWVLRLSRTVSYKLWRVIRLRSCNWFFEFELSLDFAFYGLFWSVWSTGSCQLMFYSCHSGHVWSFPYLHLPVIQHSRLSGLLCDWFLDILGNSGVFPSLSWGCYLSFIHLIHGVPYHSSLESCHSSSRLACHVVELLGIGHRTLRMLENFISVRRL